jgi:hypothetical protein
MPPERRCPECTGPNEFLEYLGVQPVAAAEIAEGASALSWTWSPAGTFLHRYRCSRCGHVIEWRSNFRDPSHL